MSQFPMSFLLWFEHGLGIFFYYIVPIFSKQELVTSNSKCHHTFHFQKMHSNDIERTMNRNDYVELPDIPFPVVVQTFVFAIASDLSDHIQKLF